MPHLRSWYKYILSYHLVKLKYTETGKMTDETEMHKKSGRLESVPRKLPFTYVYSFTCVKYFI